MTDYHGGHVVGEHTYVDAGDYNAPAKVSILRLQASKFQFIFIVIIVVYCFACSQRY